LNEENDVIKRIIICFAIFLSFSCFSFTESGRLFAFIDAGKYGLINSKGEIVVKAIYDEIRDFFDDVASASLNGLWGYLNLQGEKITDFKYKNVFPFSDGHGVVETLDGKYFIINKNGGIDFECKFDTPVMFLEGLMLVGDHGKYGFVNESGRIVIDLKYDECLYTGTDSPQEVVRFYPYGFHEGLAPVCKNGKVAFIDKTGRQITEFIFDFIEYFKNGIAVVSENDKFGIIDNKGNFILGPEYTFISGNLGGFIALNKAGKYGFTDMTGHLKIPFSYDYAESFRAGRALVGIYGNKKKLSYGFIDATAKVVIPFQFDKASTFDNDGYTVVQKENRIGIINKDGAFSLPLQEKFEFDLLDRISYKDHTFPFRDYIIDNIIIYIEKKTQKKGFMRIDGTLITKPIYDLVDHFEDGIAKVQIGTNPSVSKIGYINELGKYIWKPTR
jgi:hypothetical protein